MLLTVAAAIGTAAPGAAHASLLSGEALDTMADVIAWIALIVVPVVLIGLFWIVHILPEKIAHKRRHPQLPAIVGASYDASLAHFDSIGVEMVATVFMFLGGASFALHFTVLKRRDPGGYWRDTEFKAYFLLTAIVTAFASLYLFVMSEFPTLAECLRHAAFQVVSMQTTTGLLTLRPAGRFATSMRTGPSNPSIRSTRNVIFCPPPIGTARSFSASDTAKSGRIGRAVNVYLYSSPPKPRASRTRTAYTPSAGAVNASLLSRPSFRSESSSFSKGSEKTGSPFAGIGVPDGCGSTM